MYLSFIISYIGILKYQDNVYTDNAKFFIYFGESCFAIYPAINSLFYGVTQSSKRFMYALCLKEGKYNEEEEFLAELRASNIINPRYYLDLISLSEVQLLEN